jgi:DNA relaxase NicK
MQSVEYKIDWLTITKPDLELWSDAESAAFLHDFDGSNRWEKCAPPKGYSYAAKNEYGAIAACSGDRQGVILQWSGSALSMVDGMQIASLAIMNDWRITRLDINADFFGFETTVEDYKQEFLYRQCNTIARKWNEEKSPNEGHTMYIGSRKSENFMRIYNKTAETARFTDVSDLPPLWVRCELRLGDEHARSAFGMIEAAGLQNAIPMLLRGYADFPNIEEYVNMAEFPITTRGKPAKDTNTVKWLFEGVIPTLIREARLNPDLWEEFKKRVETDLLLTK